MQGEGTELGGQAGLAIDLNARAVRIDRESRIAAQLPVHPNAARFNHFARHGA
jgi:hypothetical protein